VGTGIQDGGLKVEVQGRLGMAGVSLSLRQRFYAARLQPHVLADHVVVTHAARQAPPPIALEMEDFAGLLDEIIQHPLLAIPRQTRSATDGFSWLCHAHTPP